MLIGVPKTTFVRSGLAIVTVALALFITSQFHSASYITQISTLLFAVAFATWVGGTLSGIAAVIITSLATAYFAQPGGETEAFHNSGFYRIAVYIVASGLTFYLTSLYRGSKNALSNSEDQYQYLFDSNPLPMWVYDPETLRFLAVNNAAVAYYEYTEAEFLGMTIEDITQPESVRGLRKYLATPRPDVDYRGIWKNKKKNGSIIASEVFSKQIVFRGRPARQEVAIDVSDKIRVEEFARESDARLSTIVESLKEGLLVANQKREIVHINQSAVELLGLRSKGDSDPFNEFKEQHIVCDLDGNELPESQRPLDLALAGEYVKDLAIIVRRRADGFERILECTGCPINAPDGSPSLAMITMIDVTEKRRARLELERSQRQLAGIIDSAMDAIITVNSRYEIVHFNDAAEIMFRCPAGDAIGMPINHFMPDGFIETEVEAVINLGFTSAADRIAGRIVPRSGSRFDGEVFPLEASVSFIQTVNGRLYTIIIRDITYRKAALEALEQSEARYRHLVENAVDIIYTQDLDGNLLSVNKAVERVTGFTPEEALSIDLGKLLTPDGLVQSKRLSAAKPEDDSISDYQIEMTAKEGQTLTMHINSWLVYENGQPIGIQGTARDITERRQLEEKLRQSQKLESIGMLAGGVAHDFNNLLTVINGYSEMALLKLAPDDPVRSNVEQIKDAGTRASALTSQLLAFSRNQVLKPKVHNLNTVISDLEKMLRRLVRESIDLKTNLAPELWNISADPGQIEQVIMNLTVNARDAMVDGGTFTIETENLVIDAHSAILSSSRSHGKYVLMRVRDTGVGMDQATTERIFDPFFTTKSVGKGSGLGLSTVHGIVNQSGGEISVHSRLGEGTTFEIIFPCSEAEPETIESCDESAHWFTGDESILVVEDDDNVRLLAGEVLKRNGYTVLTACGGVEAVKILKNHDHKLDLLLTDMVMPDISGQALQTKAIEIRPGLKTLFMSGYTEETYVRKGANGLAGSFKHFIEKPFTPLGLAKMVREVLDDPAH